ncbi:putative ABC exporter domain-containing protein [Anaerocolumna sp.]|uniref:putative ABC exporter domain-containing protein n=1 Tax=Anaerocolumna sp. TaxID=2041569 RepID=UPI0028AFA4F8|nr:putative ABC exporter domain-containing protein [Anaerocolumna sp.]
MKGLSYLLITSFKNRFLSLKRKPALAVVYGIIFISIILMVIAFHADSNSIKAASYQDIRILYGIIALIGMLYIVIFSTTGLSTGSTLFTMADVGLLFVSPISSRKILIYGLLKQMAATIFSALFILYQIFNLRKAFGLDSKGIVYLFIIYAITLFFCQLLSIAIYVYSNGNTVRKNIVRVIYFGIIAMTVISVFVLQSLHGGSLLENGLILVDNKLFQTVPVIGWGVMFFRAGIEGDMLSLTISLLLYILSSALIISLFTSGNADYYEDVIHSTEITHKRLQDAKEGKRTFAKNVKVKEKVTGIKKGTGSSAIFYKHILEEKRESRFPFIDTYTIIASVGAGIAGRYIPSQMAGYIILAILIYIQFFMTMVGKLTMELNRPYIYMIPQKSLYKVVAASLTTILKNAVDGILFFTIVCIVTKTSPLLNVFLALAYACSGLFFVSFQLLAQRLLGGQPNKIISLTVGLGLFFILLSPGIGFSIFAISVLPAALTFLGTLPFTFSSVIISVFIFVLCGDLLDKAEYTTGSN